MTKDPEVLPAKKSPTGTKHRHYDEVHEKWITKLLDGSVRATWVARKYEMPPATIRAWVKRARERAVKEGLEQELDNCNVHSYQELAEAETEVVKNISKPKSLSIRGEVNENISAVCKVVHELRGRVRGKVLAGSRTLDKAHARIDELLNREDLEAKDIDQLIRALRNVLELNAKLHLLPFGEILPPKQDEAPKMESKPVELSTTPSTTSEESTELSVKKDYQDDL